MVTVHKKHTLTGHNGAIYALERGLEDHIVFSSGEDGQVVEWDLSNPESGRLRAKVDASVYTMRLVPELSFLIVGQNYEGIHIIDLSNGKVAGSLKLKNTSFFDIQVKKGLVFVACGDGHLMVIDLKSLKVLDSIGLTDQNLRTICFDQDDNLIVGASDSGIRKLTFGDFQLIQQFEGHLNSVFSIKSSPNHEFFLSGSRDARLKFWKNEPELSLEEEIVAHMFAINDIAFHPDGQYFATASMDKTIKVWDYKQRKLLKVIDKARHQGHLTSVNKLIWSAFDDLLISCSDDRSLGVWDINIKK